MAAFFAAVYSDSQCVALNHARTPSHFMFHECVSWPGHCLVAATHLCVGFTIWVGVFITLVQVHINAVSASTHLTVAGQFPSVIPLPCSVALNVMNGQSLVWLLG